MVDLTKPTDTFNTQGAAPGASAAIDTSALLQHESPVFMLKFRGINDLSTIDQAAALQIREQFVLRGEQPPKQVATFDKWAYTPGSDPNDPAGMRLVGADYLSKRQVESRTGLLKGQMATLEAEQAERSAAIADGTKPPLSPVETARQQAEISRQRNDLVEMEAAGRAFATAPAPVASQGAAPR